MNKVLYKSGQRNVFCYMYFKSLKRYFTKLKWHVRCLKFLVTLYLRVNQIKIDRIFYVVNDIKNNNNFILKNKESYPYISAVSIEYAAALRVHVHARCASLSNEENALGNAGIQLCMIVVAMCYYVTKQFFLHIRTLVMLFLFIYIFLEDYVDYSNVIWTQLYQCTFLKWQQWIYIYGLVQKEKLATFYCF